MSLLEVKDLHTSFFTAAGEVKAVNGLSFNLEKGKVLDYEGESLNHYQMYLTYGTDELITHVETGVKNGRTLVVFKDSYGNALLPFLTSSFEHIYMCLNINLV